MVVFGGYRYRRTVKVKSASDGRSVLGVRIFKSNFYGAAVNYDVFAFSGFIDGVIWVIIAAAADTFSFVSCDNAYSAVFYFYITAVAENSAADACNSLTACYRDFTVRYSYVTAGSIATSADSCAERSADCGDFAARYGDITAGTIIAAADSCAGVSAVCFNLAT